MLVEAAIVKDNLIRNHSGAREILQAFETIADIKAGRGIQDQEKISIKTLVAPGTLDGTRLPSVAVLTFFQEGNYALDLHSGDLKIVAEKLSESFRNREVTGATRLLEGVIAVSDGEPVKFHFSATRYPVKAIGKIDTWVDQAARAFSTLGKPETPKMELFVVRNLQELVEIDPRIRRN